MERFLQFPFTGDRRWRQRRHRFLLLFLLYLYSPTFFAKADTASPSIIYTTCGTNKTQDPQAFDINFVNSMEIVSQMIAQNGFGISVSGDKGPVYGLGQCFNYLSSIDCQLCYAESRVKLPHCLPSTNSRIYLDGCFLRYGDYNMTTESVDSSDAYVCGNSSMGSSGSSQFNQVVTGLVGNLSEEAYGEKDYYKVGSQAVPDSGVSVYGMAQCWRSLNESGCRDCLDKAGKNVVKCLSATEGNALNAGCSVRYSTVPFYVVQGTQNTGGSLVGHQIAVAFGCLFAALVVIAIAIVWKRKWSAKSTEDMDGSSEIIRSITESNIGFKYQDLRKATDNFNPVNKLGQGGYGSVYKGILMDGKEVAVKRLYSNTRQWLDQFFNEVNLVSQVQHKNLVKLLGCSVEGPESLLVYEYLSNRSLDNFLFDSFKKNTLDWERRFEIIVGTAEGLAYLHDASEVRIIHRDIKASNILLDERFKAKIADFGLARYFAEDQSHLSTGLAGTFGYMAPEYIVHGQLTEKADTYSYGVLVLEVLTGRRNHASVEGHSLISLIWEHYTSKTLIELLDPYLQGQCSDQQILRVFHVALLCTQASPNLRPPMWKIVEMLTSHSSDVPLPTQPPFLNIKGADSKSEGSESSSIFSSTSKTPVSVNHLSFSIVQGR